MIALHRKVHEPEPKPLLPLRERPAHLAKERPAQRRQPDDEAQSDVRRVVPRQRRTAQMRDAGGAALWRPARALTDTTPPPKAESELASHVWARARPASRHRLDLALMLIRASPRKRGSKGPISS